MPRKPASETRKDITLSVKIDAADGAMIKAATETWWWRSEADLIRTALRIGFLSLQRDATPLGPPPVEPASFRALPRPEQVTLLPPSGVPDDSPTVKEPPEMSKDSARAAFAATSEAAEKAEGIGAEETLIGDAASKAVADVARAEPKKRAKAPRSTPS
jgi:hypothetical protein